VGTKSAAQIRSERFLNVGLSHLYRISSEHVVLHRVALLLHIRDEVGFTFELAFFHDQIRLAD